ncbi:hypothetical protein H6796_03040 [Candidatus Nomurabacteria bacterium]|nr:hypothetical protein [Candidatus Nomurabacteria bacterium]
MKKNNRQKTIKISKNKYTVGIASIAINAIVVIGLLFACIGYKSGLFDYAVVNKGVVKLCSEEFINKSKNDMQQARHNSTDIGLSEAQIRYQCQFYVDGDESLRDISFNDYLKSVGLSDQVQ